MRRKRQCRGDYRAGIVVILKCFLDTVDWGHTEQTTVGVNEAAQQQRQRTHQLQPLDMRQTHTVRCPLPESHQSATGVEDIPAATIGSAQSTTAFRHATDLDGGLSFFDELVVFCGHHEIVFADVVDVSVETIAAGHLGGDVLCHVFGGQL